MDSVFIAVGSVDEQAVESVLRVPDLEYKKTYVNGTAYFKIPEIRWYPDYDPVTDSIINILNNIEPCNYAFVRLGEEVEDTEIHGMIQNFGVTVERSVQVE